MDTKWKNSKGRSLCIAVGIVFVITALLLSFFPVFERQASQEFDDPLTSPDFVEALYGSNYVQYKFLRDRVDQKDWSYADLYLEDTYFGAFAPGEWEDVDAVLVDLPQAATAKSELLDRQLSQYKKELLPEMAMLQAMTYELTQDMDYYAVDTVTGTAIGNSGQEALRKLIAGEEIPEEEEPYVYYICIAYDGAGNAVEQSVKTAEGNATEFLKRAEAAGRQHPFSERFDESGRMTLALYTSGQAERYYYELSVKGPANMRIVYGATREQYDQLLSGWNSILPDHRQAVRESYRKAGIGRVFWGFEAFSLLAGAAAAFLLGRIWPGSYVYPESFLCKMPPEGAALFLALSYPLGTLAQDWIMGYQKGWFLPNLSRNILAPMGLEWLLFFILGGLLFLLLFLAFSVGSMIMTMRPLKAYLKERSVLYRYGDKIAGAIRSFYAQFVGFDIGKDAGRIIFRLVLINFFIVWIISLFRGFSFILLIVYSLAVYFLLRKYVRNAQKGYQAMLLATSAIAQGNYDIALTGDFGVFESYRSQLDQIQRDFRRAVAEEVKSQRLRSELITNVSHDLKTPLTAIITYINLLKEPDVTQRQREEYLEILDKKAVRLKVLIDDLFEVSKISTNNITVNYADVDLVNLLRQCYLEHEDRFARAGLCVKFLFAKEKVVIRLDPQKTFRIFDNLYSNIIKYALPSTRVYVSVKEFDQDVVVELKNISRSELNIDPSELLERFVRGDSARNTEGSGLGLAIAQSFTQLQHGTLHISLDGDLFKVTLLFHRWDQMPEGGPEQRPEEKTGEKAAQTGQAPERSENSLSRRYRKKRGRQ